MIGDTLIVLDWKKRAVFEEETAENDMVFYSYHLRGMGMDMK
jgi:hypothetical protein